ncbi:MAG: hypothetical protein Q8O15_10360 [Rectinemataceae bacterium]|nr:hypothetical protein [Rectinemataceae bacterium]
MNLGTRKNFGTRKKPDRRIDPAWSSFEDNAGAKHKEFNRFFHMSLNAWIFPDASSFTKGHKPHTQESFTSFS